MKKIITTLSLIVCLFAGVFCLGGCGGKIDNPDILKVLPTVKGSYVEVDYPTEALRPEGFLKAYKINNDVYVVKSTDVWEQTNRINVYTAMKNNKYLAITVEASEENGASAETVAKLQADVDKLESKDIKFAFTTDMQNSYNYPKALNVSYSFMKFMNAKVMVADNFTKITREIKANVGSGEGIQGVTYNASILSKVSSDGKQYVIAETVPFNEVPPAFYPVYCSVKIYVVFDSTGAVESRKIIEMYSSPTAGCYHTDAEFEAIFGLTDFEAEKGNNDFISGGTLTAGAAWYALSAAQDYIYNGNLA